MHGLVRPTVHTDLKDHTAPAAEAIEEVKVHGYERPVIRMRLRGASARDGEIPLTDLGRLADETQALVRRLARGLVGQRGPGRASFQIERSTALTLVGLHAGSTVLEIAGPVEAEDALDFGNMPLDLGDRALIMFLEGMSALGSADPELPVGYDAAAVNDLQAWLRSVRGYKTVELDSDIRGRRLSASIEPAKARRTVRGLQPQPSMPYVSPTEQALEGTLYALNMHTGTYSIKDDSQHTIRLKLPSEIREEAAQLINQRVRAIGRPEMDDSHRLTAFTAYQLIPAPDLAVLHQQGRFFERHDLVAGATADDRTLNEWVIEDLSDEEVDGFLSALRS